MYGICKHVQCTCLYIVQYAVHIHNILMDIYKKLIYILYSYYHLVLVLVLLLYNIHMYIYKYTVYYKYKIYLILYIYIYSMRNNNKCYYLYGYVNIYLRILSLWNIHKRDYVTIYTINRA